MKEKTRIYLGNCWEQRKIYDPSFFIFGEIWSPNINPTAALATGPDKGFNDEPDLVIGLGGNLETMADRIAEEMNKKNLNQYIIIDSAIYTFHRGKTFRLDQNHSYFNGAPDNRGWIKMKFEKMDQKDIDKFKELLDSKLL